MGRARQQRPAGGGAVRLRALRRAEGALRRPLAGDSDRVRGAQRAAAAGDAALRGAAQPHRLPRQGLLAARAGGRRRLPRRGKLN